MSTRRAAAAKNESQTLVNDYFKTTRRTAKKQEKKIIEAAPNVEKRVTRSRLKELKLEPAPIIRERTPSPKNTKPTEDGSPAKKSKTENDLSIEYSKVSSTTNSAIDELITGKPVVQKKKKIRTVADLQARLDEKGAVGDLHKQNLENKSKRVEQLTEKLKSPKKVPSKASDYVLPGFKNEERIKLEKERTPENEEEENCSNFLKSSRLLDQIKQTVEEGRALPDSYQFVLDSFQHLDRIVSIITNQKRTCVLNELVKNIRNTMKRDFTESHVAQILFVYPESYNVEVREQWKPFGGIQAGKYELVVMPNMNDDLKGCVKDDLKKEVKLEEIPLVRPGKVLSSPVKSSRKAPSQPLPRMPEIDMRVRLDASRMRDRHTVLKYKLIEMVKKDYAEFLKKNGIEYNDNHKRFHPMFQLNKHCKPLEKATLPELPNSLQKQHHVGMKEYVENNMDDIEIQLPSMVQKAIDGLKSPMKMAPGSSVPLSPKKFAQMKEEQKGRASLLERIRAKEATRKVAESFIDEGLKDRRAQLSLIETRYLRTLCSLYASKKARSMELSIVADKLVFSSSIPTTRENVVKHIETLSKIAENYMKIVVVMGKRYLQILENNYEEILEIVSCELNKVEQSLNEQRKKIEMMGSGEMLSQGSLKTTNLTPRPLPAKASKAARALKFA